MTNDDGWGSKWPVAEISLETAKERLSKVEWPLGHDKMPWPISSNMAEEVLKQDSGVTPEILGVKPVNLDWAKSPTSSRLISHDSKIFKSQGSNLVDDQAYLYFQCESCNEILDPHTKSFAKLQEHRINAGWKCIWNMNGQGYKVYCEKCEEKV